MTVRQEAFHAMRFELYCSGIEVDPDDCVAGAVDLREAWAAGAAAERDRIRQLAQQRLDLLPAGDYSPAAQALADILIITGGES